MRIPKSRHNSGNTSFAMERLGTTICLPILRTEHFSIDTDYIDLYSSEIMIAQKKQKTITIRTRKASKHQKAKRQ